MQIVDHGFYEVLSHKAVRETYPLAGLQHILLLLGHAKPSRIELVPKLYAFCVESSVVRVKTFTKDMLALKVYL